MDRDAVLELAEQWLSLDQDPETKSQISKLVAAENLTELEKRLHPRISFGTAGLRGRMEAGFARMNAVTVIQATQGLGAYLLANAGKFKLDDASEIDARDRGVVIGYDHRHNSALFADLAEYVLHKMGIRVFRYPKPIHTPLVPFSIKALRSPAMGIMITASHNPPQDNGYKVYWSNACQIIPPHDLGIAASILQHLQPLAWGSTRAEDGAKGSETTSLEAIEDAYYRHIAACAGTASITPFTFTPLHGVGTAPMTHALRAIHPTSPPSDIMSAVPEQTQPDPDFPTVAFPNPEEKGALDLAIRTAEQNGHSLIVAVDPDADRLAIAQKLARGRWHQFSGNQVGVLLASHVLDTYGGPRDRLAMLNTTVSTSMLRAMAGAEGFHFVETLTGFKWLGNVAQRLEREEGWDVLYAFEEALGYMFTRVGHDKDGITAASVFLVAVERWKSDGNMTPWDKLQTLYAKYGFFEEANTYLITPDASTTTRIFEDVRRAYPQGSAAKALGPRRITRWRDLTTGYDSGSSDGVPDLPVDGSSQMITCELEGGTRFTVRGSGTEPKVKIYIDSQGGSEAEAKAEAFAVQRDLIELWMRPEVNGLRLP